PRRWRTATSQPWRSTSYARRFPPSSLTPTSSTARSPSWPATSRASSTPTPRRSPSWRSARSFWRGHRAIAASATGCCVVRVAPSARSSRRELRQRGNDRSHARKPLAVVMPDALNDYAVVGAQAHQRRVLLQPGDELLGLGELVVVQRQHD